MTIFRLQTLASASAFGLVVAYRQSAPTEHVETPRQAGSIAPLAHFSLYFVS